MTKDRQTQREKTEKTIQRDCTKSKLNENAVSVQSPLLFHSIISGGSAQLGAKLGSKCFTKRPKPETQTAKRSRERSYL